MIWGVILISLAVGIPLGLLVKLILFKRYSKKEDKWISEQAKKVLNGEATNQYTDLNGKRVDACKFRMTNEKTGKDELINFGDPSTQNA